jgi:hypothetical protein
MEWIILGKHAMYFAIESQNCQYKFMYARFFQPVFLPADVALQRFWFLLYTNLLEFRDPIYG